MSGRSSAERAPSRYSPISRFQEDPAGARKILGHIKKFHSVNPIEAASAENVPRWIETQNDLARSIAFMAMDGRAWQRWAQFWNGPRQIFDLSGPLIPAFEATDVDEVPVAALREPYRECYLHFGPNSGARIIYPQNPMMPDKLTSFRLDGVFVHVYRDHEPDTDAFTAMELDFTTRWVGPNVNSPRPRGVAEPIFSARISGNDTTPMRVPLDDPRNGDPLVALQTVREGIADGTEYEFHNARYHDEKLREKTADIAPQLLHLKGTLEPVTIYEDHAKAISPVLREGIG